MGIWYVCECAGIFCVILTYIIVLSVQWGFMRIALWEGLVNGDTGAYIHLAIFQYHVALIFISHVKCMTSQPGVVPKQHANLKFKLMGEPLQTAILELRDEVKQMTRDVSMEGPTEINAAKMNLEEQVACLRRKNYKEMDTLLVKFDGIDDDKVEIKKKINDPLKKRENLELKEEDEKDGSHLVKHNRYLKFLTNVLSKKCKKCDSLKPPGSHHCSTCGRCIARMDHHCPWVNNCVGYYNQKYFLQFLVYVFLGSMHALVMIILKGWDCFDKNCATFQHTGAFVLTIISGFLAVLFGLFVAIMFFDQMQCILENTNTIDELKKRSGIAAEEEQGEQKESRTAWENVKEVFGRADKDADIWWLWPTPVERNLVIEREFD